MSESKPSVSKETSKPALIVWDMDGTITSSAMARFIPSDMESYAFRVIGTVEKAFQAARGMRDLVTDGFRIPTEIKGRVMRSAIKLRPDIIDVMSAFANAGTINIIVSNNARSWGEKLMTHLGVRSVLHDSFFGDDRDHRTKPDPSSLLQSIKKFQIPPGKTILVVGDSRRDMEYAKAAQRQEPEYKIVSVAMGDGSRAAQSGPDYIVDTPLDIRALFL